MVLTEYKGFQSVLCTKLSENTILKGEGEQTFEKITVTDEELDRAIEQALQMKLAAIALGISLPVLADFVVSVLDPAEKITNYIDSKDVKPKNGYFDVIW